jgi:putative protein-disulfide isomerase
MDPEHAMTTTLHYIHDPLCGWCYGAAPLVAAARAALPVVLHGGGMMTGARRQPVTPALRAYVMPHDQRIAALSGQPFGAAYFEGLLRDGGAVFDSEPPTTAILAADTLGGRGAELLARIQLAHYVEGRRIADDTVLADLAAGIGLHAAAFSEAFGRLRGAATQAHIADTRALLAQVGGGGFPTFVLERRGADGQRQFERIDAQAWYGRPEAFVHRLLRQEAGAGVDVDAPSCSIDGC